MFKVLIDYGLDQAIHANAYVFHPRYDAATWVFLKDFQFTAMEQEQHVVPVSNQLLVDAANDILQQRLPGMDTSFLRFFYVDEQDEIYRIVFHVERTLVYAGPKMVSVAERRLLDNDDRLYGSAIKMLAAMSTLDALAI